MPIVSQSGTYTAGTSGFPIECDLTPLETGKLVGVATLQLTLTRPNGSSTTRSLPLPGSIIDTAGKIQFTVQNGDLPIEGVYTIRFNILFASSAVLVLSGDFKVIE